jgi:hypothetical protein
MRALLIDAEQRTITEIEFKGNYQDIQAVLGCRQFTTGSRPLLGSLEEGFDAVYVSDDDMEDREDPRHWFQVDALRSPPSSYPLAGRGLVLGVDKDGEDCDARISLVELTERITFTMRKFRGFEVSSGRGQIAEGWPVSEIIRVDLKAPIIDGGSEE